MKAALQPKLLTPFKMQFISDTVPPFPPICDAHQSSHIFCKVVRDEQEVLVYFEHAHTSFSMGEMEAVVYKIIGSRAAGKERGSSERFLAAKR